MKIPKNELKLGDIIRESYLGHEVFYKVVEAGETKLYDPKTFEPVYPIIVDGYVVNNGNRFGQRLLGENEVEFDVVYRENPEPYVPLSEVIKNSKKDES